MLLYKKKLLLMTFGTALVITSTYVFPLAAAVIHGSRWTDTDGRTDGRTKSLIPFQSKVDLMSPTTIK